MTFCPAYFIFFNSQTLIFPLYSKLRDDPYWTAILDAFLQNVLHCSNVIVGMSSVKSLVVSTADWVRISSLKIF